MMAVAYVDLLYCSANKVLKQNMKLGISMKNVLPPTLSEVQNLAPFHQKPKKCVWNISVQML